MKVKVKYLPQDPEKAWMIMPHKEKWPLSDIGQGV